MAEKASNLRRLIFGWWGRQDSNLRSHEAADLQSAPFATRDTPPLDGVMIRYRPRRPWTRPSSGENRFNPVRVRGRRVYGRSTLPKSTDGILKIGAIEAQIAIVRNP